MNRTFFIGIKDEGGYNISFCNEVLDERINIDLINSYFRYSLTDLKKIFSTIEWINEADCPNENKESHEYRLFVQRHKRGTDIIFLLELGSNEALVKFDADILEESTKALRKYERQMYQKTGDEYYKHKTTISYPSTIKYENGSYTMVLINQTDYLDNPDWEYGFVFNLIDDTLEIHSRRLLEQNGADNMIWKVITRDMMFDENTFELD